MYEARWFLAALALALFSACGSDGGDGGATGPNSQPNNGNTYVPFKAALSGTVRDRALIAHATQIDPDGPWFAIPLEVHQTAWPTEDFSLVESLVPAEVPEDDLFASIRGLAEEYDGRRESIAV